MDAFSNDVLGSWSISNLVEHAAYCTVQKGVNVVFLCMLAPLIALPLSSTPDRSPTEARLRVWVRVDSDSSLIAEHPVASVDWFRGFLRSMSGLVHGADPTDAGPRGSHSNIWSV